MKLYAELAEWWPLMSAPEEYVEEAGFYVRTLCGAVHPPPRTLLELGSGGGNNASHMKGHFASVTLVEPAAGMRAVSAALNPDCEHIEGDMRTVRLGRTFDCVFVHDAVMYMTSEADLGRALETAHLHCRPGGAVLFAPDAVKETFRASTDCGGHDQGARGLRYLEWCSDPDPADTTSIVDYVYLLRREDGSVDVVHDRHLEGLFARETWLRLLRDVGFAATVVPFDHSELEPGTYQLFLGRKPGG